MTTLRLRLALAPTTHLTLNAARVALANAGFARRGQAHLTLRLDDLNEERARPAYAETIVRDLAWIGVSWDETIRQSDRRERHAEAIAQLQRDKRLYPCFESDAELRAKADQRRRRGKPEIYDRAMLSLTDAQRAAAEAGGKRPYWRFRLSEGERSWSDMILGRRHARRFDISDPVMVREDGSPSPALAAAIDDLDARITHLIRAEENAGDTFIHMDVMTSLDPGVALPAMASVPALDQEGRSAGRKQGSRPVRDLRDDGVLAPALAAWLVGTTLDDPIPERFHLKRLRDAPDAAGLLALNRSALSALPFTEAAALLPAGATEAFWNAIRGGIDLARDADHWWDVVAGDLTPTVADADTDALAQALLFLPRESSDQASPDDVTRGGGTWDETTWSRWIGALPDSHAATLYRVLTGEDAGPDLGPLLAMMGRDRAERRLRDAMGGD